MSKDRDKKLPQHTKSSGNVFADLALPASAEDMLKVEVARAIGKTIERRGLTQVEAAKRLGTDQAKISAIVRGRLKDFAVDRLFNYLVALGHDVDIHISQRLRRTEGKIRVSA
jgi:predicted XRE-type DNA-binding protein